MTPVVADDVYLKNGQVFEGVIAVEDEGSVLVRLEIGQLTLPKSQVLRIDHDSSPLEEFRRFLKLRIGLSQQDFRYKIPDNWLPAA